MSALSRFNGQEEFTAEPQGARRVYCKISCLLCLCGDNLIKIRRAEKAKTHDGRFSQSAPHGRPKRCDAQ